MKDCQQISEEIEKGKITALTVSERIGIRFHLSFCKGCRRYVKDSQLLDRLLRHRDKKQYCFSTDEKARLKSKLK